MAKFNWESEYYTETGGNSLREPLISEMSKTDLIQEIMNYQYGLLWAETLDSLKAHVIQARIRTMHKKLHAEAGFDAAHDIGESGQYL